MQHNVFYKIESEGVTLRFWKTSSCFLLQMNFFYWKIERIFNPYKGTWTYSIVTQQNRERGRESFILIVFKDAFRVVVVFLVLSLDLHYKLSQW